MKKLLIFIFLLIGLIGFSQNRTINLDGGCYIVSGEIICEGDTGILGSGMITSGASDGQMIYWNESLLKFDTIPISQAKWDSLNGTFIVKELNVLGQKTTNDLALFTNEASNLIGDSGVVIDSKGNVGIGITPTQKIDVDGSIAISGTKIITLPNQTTLTGSLIYGTGGENLVNTTGDDGKYNNLFGIGAGNSLTTGEHNQAMGYLAGYSNTTGSNWNAIGNAAGYSNTTGSNWNAIGYRAGRYLADGATEAEVFNNSTYIGSNTKVSANGVTNENVIGYNATGNGSNSVTLGDDNIVKTILKGNVGIGTTSPTAKLTIDGNKTTSNLFEAINDNDGLIGDSTFIINKLGYAGINKTPTYALDINGDAYGDTARFLSYVGHSDFNIGSGHSGVSTLTFADNSTMTTKGAEIGQTMYIGTTGIAINRTSAALTLAGITLTTPDIGTPSAGTLTNCTFPTLNQNTSGTAANLSGTPALPNGVSATTQSASDNSTKVATTAYVDAAAAASLWTDDGSQTYLTADSEPFELRKTGLATGFTSFGNTDAYVSWKLNDADGGFALNGMVKVADAPAAYFRGLNVQATPTEYPMIFAVGRQSGGTWSSFGAGKKAFTWNNSNTNMMTLSSSSWLRLGGEATYHQIGVYDATPTLCLTDNDINLNVSSASEAQDSNAVWIKADDATPEIGISGGNGDSWDMTINTVDGALFENATTYNFDNDVLITGSSTISEGQNVNITTVNAALYDLLATDYILNITYTATGAVTSLTLPTAQTVEGRIITIKDAGGLAGTNNITVDCEAAQNIDGSSTFILNTNYESISLYCDGTNWFIY